MKKVRNDGIPNGYKEIRLKCKRINGDLEVQLPDDYRASRVLEIILDTGRCIILTAALTEGGLKYQMSGAGGVEMLWSSADRKLTIKNKQTGEIKLVYSTYFSDDGLIMDYLKRLVVILHGYNKDDRYRLYHKEMQGQLLNIIRREDMGRHVKCAFLWASFLTFHGEEAEAMKKLDSLRMALGVV